MKSVWRLWLTMCLLGAWAGVGLAHAGALEDIQAKKQVRVCIWPDYFGISYRDPKTRQLSGIDVDMAKLLADDLKVELQFVDSSFSRLVEDLTQSRCDIAMFAIGITPQRLQHLRFTKPHLASDIMAITTKSNRRIQNWSDIDAPTTVVAVAKGTLHESVMKSRLQHAELKVLDTAGAREQEVESGRADVFMTDYPFSQRMLKTTDWARLVTPPSTYHITPYAWAVKPGEEPWLERVNQFLIKSKNNGSLKQAAQRHGLTPIVLLD